MPEAFQGLLDVFGEVREPSCDLEFERADSVGSIESRRARRAWERFTWMNGIPSLGPDPDSLNPQLCRSGAVLSAEAGRSDAPIYRAGRDVLAIREAGG